MNTNRELNLAEIPYETGELRFRYSRYLSSEKNRWIRHGLFCSYYPNGRIASEGNYLDGKENGVWKDFHENSQIAAEGTYTNGEKIGVWKYWDSNGKLEIEENYSS